MENIMEKESCSLAKISIMKVILKMEKKMEKVF